MARLVVWFAVLVRGPPLGGACCVGVWPASWLDVLCLCVARRHGPACCVGAGPAAVVQRAVPVRGAPPQSNVLLWCISCLVGRAVPVCFPPRWLCLVCWCLASIVGCLATSWWACLCLVFSRLYVWLVLLVRCSLRCLTVGVYGCQVSAFVVGSSVSVAYVLVAGPGRAGRTQERVRCAPFLSRPGQTGQPLDPVLLLLGGLCPTVRFPLFRLHLLVSARLLAVRWGL